jgi:UDP-glucose 4-epimerase
MRILITGCAGFIGSNLARRLLNDGHDVIGIDNFSHGLRENIEGLEIEFYETDLTCDFDFPQFDLCIHLASEKIPRYTNAFRTLTDNHEMIERVIYACLKNNAKLMYASTSDVYGKNLDLPYYEESALVLGPTTVKRWAYAVSKIHGEHYIQACADEYGLEYVIMRFFSAYGPRQNRTWWGGPQGVFIQKMLRGEEMDIHGDGMQTRCFTYIDDLVDGIVHCMRTQNEIFNIGSTEEMTIFGLATTIAALMNAEPKLRFIPYETFGKYEDVRFRRPDVTKLERLGWRAKTDLIEGLKKTIAWQRSVL